MDLLVLSRSGNSITVKNRVALSFSGTGTDTFRKSELGTISMSAGDLLGFWIPSSNHARVAYATGSGTRYWSLASNPTGTQNWTLLTGPIQFAFEAKIDRVEILKSKLEPNIQTQLDLIESSLIVRTFHKAIPEDQSSASSTNNAYLHELPIARMGYISTIRAYVKSVGSMTVLVLQKIAANLSVRTSFTLSASSVGLKEWIANRDFSPIIVNPGEVVAWYAASSGGLTIAFSTPTNREIRTLTLNSLPTSTWTVWSAASAGYTLEFGFDVTEFPDSLSSNKKIKILDQEINNSLPVAWTFNGPWSASNGLIGPTPDGTLTNYGRTQMSYGSENRISWITFVAGTTTDRLLLGFSNYASGQTALALATGFQIDGTDGDSRIRICTTRSSSFTSVPATTASTVMPVLVAGRVYRIELISDRRKNTATIIDLTSGVRTSVVHDANATSSSNLTTGEQKDHLFISYIAGSPKVTKVEVWINELPFRHCLALGDSLTNGYGVSLADRWTQLIKDELDGDMIIDGRDGAMANNTWDRFMAEGIFICPRFVLWNIGTNDLDSGISSLRFRTNTLKFWCDAVGASLVVCKILPANGIDVDGINSYLSTLTGIYIVNVDKALSVDNDGVTPNASLLQADGLHWNAAGNLAVFNQVKTDAPELFN